MFCISPVDSFLDICVQLHSWSDIGFRIYSMTYFLRVICLGTLAEEEIIDIQLS